MTTKTITITETAYDFLKAKKKDYESFSDIIVKLSRKVKLSDFAGLLSEEEAKITEERIKRSRAASNKRMDAFRSLLR